MNNRYGDDNNRKLSGFRYAIRDGLQVEFALGRTWGVSRRNSSLETGLRVSWWREYKARLGEQESLLRTRKFTVIKSNPWSQN